VDTAPTGHTLRLLALPELALEWVRALLATLLKYRQILGLGALASDLVELSRGLRQLRTLLADPRQARVVVVTRAAALPSRETIRLLRHLDTLGLTVSALVVNALTPSGMPCATAARMESAHVRRLRAVVRSRMPGLPVLLAPAVAPPPRGVKTLRSWARTWTRAAS
jgi:arsenite-transporting ATPase